MMLFSQFAGKLQKEKAKSRRFTGVCAPLVAAMRRRLDDMLRLLQPSEGISRNADLFPGMAHCLC